MSEKQNLVKRIFCSVFSVLNISRKLILNLLFFGLIIIFIMSVNNDNHKVLIENNSLLIMNLKGDIVEQKKYIDPMDAFMSEALAKEGDDPEILLADILKVLDSAATDNRITTLVLKLDNVGNAGLTKMDILANAINQFKTSGKKVIAIGEHFTQNQYYLASYADEIWLDTNGWLILDGFGRYQMYYKSAIEKLSITPYVFRVGKFKSAVEPYLRDDMSPQAKEANKLWLNDLWTYYKTKVSEQRGFDLANFDENTETLISKLESVNGDIAQYALENLWVDQLKSRFDVEKSLNELSGVTHSDVNNNDNTYKSVNFNDYLSTLTHHFPIPESTNNKIAIIVAKGTILNGNKEAGNIGGDSTAKLLKKARENELVKAVVLRVDSPGGSAFASEIIRQEVELLKEAGKPVIASMGTYAASGGYWISASADKIFAAPTTITGSIGIYGLMMTFENALSKLGIYTDGVGTTDFAGFSPTRPLSDGVAKIIQMNVNKGYQDFISLVSKNRNMTLEEVDAIAQGRVWSGAKAKELGLVDELGGLEEAIVEAAKLANISAYDTLLIEKELSPADQLIKNIMGQASSVLPSSVVTLSPIEKAISKLKGELEHLSELNDPKSTYTLCMNCEVN